MHVRELPPFHIMHGVEPVPNPRPCIEEEVQPDRTPVEWYDDASRDVELAIESAHTSLEGYRDRMKQTYDRRRGATNVNNGDQVYLRNDTKTYSLDPIYNGPFPVVSAKPPNVTIDVGGGKRKSYTWTVANDLTVPDLW